MSDTPRVGATQAGRSHFNEQIDPENSIPGQEKNIPQENSLSDISSDSQAAVHNYEGTKKAAVESKGFIDIAANAMKASLNAAVEKTPKMEDFVADYPIKPGSDNKLHTHDQPSVKGSWPNISIVHNSVGYRNANSAGLQQHLTQLNGGLPLTDFEKQLIANWHKEDSLTTLTPIMQVGERGVQAYMITKGGSGGLVTTTYDRDGKKLDSYSHFGPALVNEGLGLIDYVFLAPAVKNVIKLLISKAGRLFTKRAAAKAAATATARSEGEAAASGAGKQSANSTSKQGSGTTLNKRPVGPAAEFTEREENEIRRLMRDQGLSREEAEETIKYYRKHGYADHIPQPPNRARRPPWKPPGPKG